MAKLRLSIAIFLTILLALGGSGTVRAQQPTTPAGPPSPTRQAGPPLGIVPPAPEQAAKAAGGGGGGPSLSYHGGPVMQASNTVYAIYWVPPGYGVSGQYESLINRFFTDVAADHGQTTNVYYSDTQYSSIQDNSALGGSYVDVSPLPASGCTDTATAVCLTDAQLQTEIMSAVTAAGWTVGPNKIFFMFTAKGIGSCVSGYCAFTQYCAYHSWFFQSNFQGGATVYYANMPYADTVPAACDAGQHPNNDDADATINVTSHEHNETITDQHGSAWYDPRGQENGDKCAWKFGTLQGTSPNEYNQVINTNHYFLQQEWSNKSSGCVLQGL